MQILNFIWQRKHRWIGHFRHNRLLHEIIQGRMRGKPTRGKRIQMLHGLANDGGFVALKRAAEDREGWKHSEMTSETCATNVFESAGVPPPWDRVWLIP